MRAARRSIHGLSQRLLGWMGDRTSPVEIELLKRIMDGQASCLVCVLLAAGIIFVVKFIQARAEAVAKHEGRVFLDWKEPVDGGAVASYKIERRGRVIGRIFPACRHHSRTPKVIQDIMARPRLGAGLRKSGRGTKPGSV